MPHDPLMVAKAIAVILTAAIFLLAATILGALAPGDDYPSQNRIVGWVG